MKKCMGEVLGDEFELLPTGATCACRRFAQGVDRPCMEGAYSAAIFLQGEQQAEFLGFDLCVGCAQRSDLRVEFRLHRQKAFGHDASHIRIGMRITAGSRGGVRLTRGKWFPFVRRVPGALAGAHVSCPSQCWSPVWCLMPHIRLVAYQRPWEALLRVCGTVRAEKADARQGW